MNLNKTIFIFDVDSTLVKGETLEDVIEIAIKDNENKAEILNQVQKITDLGMEGKMNFNESLKKRVSLAQIFQKHLDKYNHDILPNKIDLQFKEIMQIIRNNGSEVVIVSGGFDDNISVVQNILGVKSKNTFTNTFIKDGEKIIGFDENNILANSDGKVEVAKKLKLIFPNYKMICIGDGNSDYLIRKNKVADEFWGFWANVKREAIAKRADKNFYASDELLQFIKEYFNVNEYE